MTAAAHFTLVPAATDADLLGVWAEADPTGSPDVSFSPPTLGVAAPDEPTWRVELPADPAGAGPLLALARARVDGAGDRLALVPDELAAWLEDDRRPAVDAERGAGTADAAPGRVRDALEVMTRFTRSCAPIAWVETCADGRVRARSRTTLSGRLSTVLLARDADVVDRHRAALALTAATRITALRAAATTMRAAVAIAARLSVPGGPLLALPLAWRLVQRVTINTGHPGGASHGPD